MNPVNILGVYRSSGSAARAIASIRMQQLGDVLAYSPWPDHAIAGALPHQPSSVRLFTLVGAVLGCVLGVSLAGYTMVDWPLITGGKPLVSIPPLVVIGFEAAMLLAALSAATGFLLLSRLPALARPVLYDARFSEDHFGVLVTCSPHQARWVRTCLEQAGAEEVRSE